MTPFQKESAKVEFDSTLPSDIYTGWKRWNGNDWCDADDGPCACGAWHNKKEDRVFWFPIYRKTWQVE